MGYAIRFDGAAPAELTQLLRAVEGRLNWQGVQSAMATDEAISQSGASVVQPCIRAKDCSDVPPHGPNFVALFVAFAIGVGVGYAIARFFPGKPQSFT